MSSMNANANANANAHETMTPKETLTDLHEAIKLCDACPLRTRVPYIPVPSEGKHTAKVFLLGRNPGREEVQQGRPFVGASGNRLDDFLHDAELASNREERADKLYTANLVKCFTLKNAIPEWPYCLICARRWLLEEFKIVKPKLLLVFGNEAKRYIHTDLHLIEKACQGKSKRRKSLLVRFIIHPAAALRIPIYEAELRRQARELREANLV